MPEVRSKTASRRRFLRLLAGAPLVASSGLAYASLAKLATARSGEAARDAVESALQGEGLITAPEQALNVMEFEAVARKELPPAHFGYLATGVDDDATVHANREGYNRLEIRTRRLVDVRNIDTSVRLFGATWDTPIVIAPVGSQKAFHPDGEIAVAKAAQAKGQLQILSTNTTSSVEDVIAARGAPVWFQLYPTTEWNVTRAMVKRAEAAGCPVLVLTVDLREGSNRETLRLFQRADSRQCSACHASGVSGRVRRKLMYNGLDLSKLSVTGVLPAEITWDYLKRLKEASTMKLVIKGIVTREDAQLAVEHGVDGIIVSNHGGRAEETNRPTIECLPEVLEGVAGRIPVLVDGGIRRGTDIFKALGLGATAICVGRPYIWGLAAFGQAGVETVLAILRRELQTIMRQAGTTSIASITRAYVVDRPR